MPKKMPTHTTDDQDRSGPATAERGKTRRTGGVLERPVARRALLAGSSAAAAAAAYAAIGSGDAGEAAKEEAPSDPRRLSYRETDHIRQFYARARF